MIIGHTYSHSGVEINEVVDEACTEFAKLLPKPSYCMPPSHRGVKTLIRERMAADEGTVMSELKEKNSISARLIVDNNIRRRTIRTALHSLPHERSAHVHLAHFLGATRFKRVTNMGVMNTLCRICEEEVDSPEHCLNCITWDSQVFPLSVAENLMELGCTLRDEDTGAPEGWLQQA